MSKMIAQSFSHLRAARKHWYSTIVLVLLSIAALPLLDRSLRRLSIMLRYKYPNDGLEGTLLHEARLVWAGQPLYRPLTPREFVSAPYPPVHTAAIALLDQIAGPHPFWGGRAVSALAAIGLVVLIILIVRAVGSSWLAGCLGAAIFFSAPTVLLWGSRIKPDMLAICFATAGLLCALLAIERKPNNANRSSHAAWRWLVAAAGWFTLAFFTRQTTLMAAFAVSLGLVLNDLLAWRIGQLRDPFWRLPLRRQTVWFGVLLVGLMLGIWGLADLITSGQYTAHVWGLHNSSWWSLYLVQKYAQRLTPYWPSVVLLVPLLTLARTNPRTRILACYVLIAPITILGAAEISANHNHLLETNLAIGLTCGMALAWAAGATSNTPRSLVARVMVVSIFAGQLWAAYQPQPTFAGEFRPSDPPERFVAFIQQTPGEVLVDDQGLLIATDRPIRYDDPSTMGPAARSGIWDQRGLIDEIRQRKFSAILIRDDVTDDPYDEIGRWTTEMRAAIRDSYVIKFRDRIRVYVPKP